MKNIRLSSSLTETFSLDYENGFVCEYTLVDDILINYTFKKGDLKLRYCDDIEYYINNVWSDIDYSKLPSLTMGEIEEFNSFDKLYYFGGGYDGKTKDSDGNEISTPIKFSDNDCSISLDIETSEQECKDILASLKYGEIMDSGIYYIPSYNQDKDKTDHYTIYFMVKLDQDIFDKVYESKYKISTYRNIFHYMKTGEVL